MQCYLWWSLTSRFLHIHQDLKDSNSMLRRKRFFFMMAPLSDGWFFIKKKKKKKKNMCSKHCIFHNNYFYTHLYSFQFLGGWTLFSSDPGPKGSSSLKALWRSHLTSVRRPISYRIRFKTHRSVSAKKKIWKKNVAEKLIIFHEGGSSFFRFGCLHFLGYIVFIFSIRSSSFLV